MSPSALRAVGWALGGALVATFIYVPNDQFASWLPPGAYGQQASSIEFPAAPARPTVQLTPEELANIRVYEVANRSVVNIDTRTEQVDPFFMRRIPGAGSGSGSILDKRGHVLTNAHVIDNAKEIEVTLAEGQTYRARLIGKDTEHDIAVLKIDAPAEELYPIPLGNSEGLRVGQQVYTLGNPFGLEGTLTKGIISSLNRSIDGRTGREMRSLIQTDAAMNPGNSGGPLLDSGARMIGMNVAIASRTGQNTGVGFAIPVNRIRTIVQELIKHGRIIRPDHGILVLRESEEGIKIYKIRPDGPADRAGLQAIEQTQLRRQGNRIYQTTTRDFSRGDWLIAVDGEPVRTHSEFLDIMDTYKPGQTVTLTIVRDGHRKNVALTLGEA